MRNTQRTRPPVSLALPAARQPQTSLLHEAAGEGGEHVTNVLLTARLSLQEGRGLPGDKNKAGAENQSGHQEAGAWAVCRAGRGRARRGAVAWGWGCTTPRGAQK